jgi:hypothetical protein
MNHFKIGYLFTKLKENKVLSGMVYFLSFKEYPGGKDRGAESHTKTGFTKLVNVRF